MLYARRNGYFFKGCARLKRIVSYFRKTFGQDDFFQSRASRKRALTDVGNVVSERYFRYFGITFERLICNTGDGSAAIVVFDDYGALRSSGAIYFVFGAAVYERILAAGFVVLVESVVVRPVGVAGAFGFS